MESTMTQEDFANKCLRIAAGDMVIRTPCCANCEHYVEHIYDPIHLDSRWSCFHPARDVKDAELETKPEDFCSYFKERTNNK